MGLGIFADTRSRWNSTISTCLLAAAWLYGNISSLEWLFKSLRHTSPSKLMLLGVAIAIILVQLGRRNRQGENQKLINFELKIMPLVLMLGAAIGSIALRQTTDIPEFNVLLFLLGSYGFCGLFLDQNFWYKNLPVAALIACIIPFNGQIGTGLGTPARIITAHGVEKVLSTWNIAAISSNDIILLENGVAHVDLPCSGLKSLRTGTLFLLAVTWLESRKLGWRWLLVCVANFFFLISANTVRVLLLVILVYVAKLPKIAEVLHIPLGILGFIFAVGITWILLQKVPKHQEERYKEKSDRNLRIEQTLLISVICLALVLRLQPTRIFPPTITAINWPQQIKSEVVSLLPAEEKFFNSYGSTTISEKRRFVYENISGSMLVVASTSWGSFHAPEWCFVGSGFKVDRIESKKLTPAIKARWLSLQNGKYSATYWLQSSGQTTDSFLYRLWSDVTKKTKTWVMISILFDSSLRPENPEIQEFAATVRDAIANSFP